MQTAELHDQLSKSCADKNDSLSLEILDLALRLPEKERDVLRALVIFRMKSEWIRERGLQAMLEAAHKFMGTILLLASMFPEEVK